MLPALHVPFEVFAPDLQGVSQLQGGYLPAPQLLVDRSTVRFKLLADLRRGEQLQALAVLVHRRSFFEGFLFEGSLFELQQRFFEPLHSTLEPFEVLHKGLQSLLKTLRGWRRRSLHTRHHLLLLNRTRHFVAVGVVRGPRAHHRPPHQVLLGERLWRILLRWWTLLRRSRPGSEAATALPAATTSSSAPLAAGLVLPVSLLTVGSRGASSGGGPDAAPLAAPFGSPSGPLAVSRGAWRGASAGA